MPLRFLSTHHGTASQTAEVAIGIHIDAGHGGAGFPGRADAQDTAVSRTRVHAPQHLAGGIHVQTPEIVDILNVQVMVAHGQAGRCRRPAGDDQGIQVGKAQGQGGTPAGMTFGVLVVVGRLEGAHGLAHEREVAGQRADGKDQGLLRIIPGPVRPPEFVEEQCRQAAAAGKLLAPVQHHDTALPGGHVDG